MGSIILGVLIVIELFFCVWNIIKNDFHRQEKSIVNISLFLLFVVLSIGGILNWSFRYYVFAFVLLIQAVLAVRRLLLCLKKNSDETEKSTNQFVKLISKSVWQAVGKSILYSAALTFAVLCPQYRLIDETGEYKVTTANFTFIDESRKQPYTAEGNREINATFWYPEYASETGEKYPLVIFSHGTYGVKLTNESLFRELASHGYIVCSLDHPYHSFFTVNDKNKVTIVSQDYLNQYMEFATTVDVNIGYSYIKEWMDIRTKDMEFVLNSIKADAQNTGFMEISEIVNTDIIIAAGHSMGGSAALSLGRTRDDISAVIALEAPYLGDITGVKDREFTWLEEGYPIPVLNIYSDSSWGEFENSVTYTQNQRMLEDLNTKNIHISGTRHLGLTDLSLLCPLAVELLDGEKSERDAHEVLKEINNEVLLFLEEKNF